jgi:hypothetical protein
MSRIECIFTITQLPRYLTNPIAEHLKQGIRMIEYLLTYPNDCICYAAASRAVRVIAMYSTSIVD